MIRDQKTLNILSSNHSRFVRERRMPNESMVAEGNKIPDDMVHDIKASGLMSSPRILLVDEPSPGLSPVVMQ